MNGCTGSNYTEMKQAFAISFFEMDSLLLFRKHSLLAALIYGHLQTVTCRILSSQMFPVTSMLPRKQSAFMCRKAKLWPFRYMYVLDAALPGNL
jgi:hypothetical protein